MLFIKAMTAGEPDFKRVTFELHRDAVPELLETLGGFAASHEIRFEFADVREQTRLETETPPYNPEYVSWLTDIEGQKVAVVTPNNLKAFENTLGKRKIATRLSHALLRPNIRYTKPYLVWGTSSISDEGIALGVRADKIEDLYESLRSGAFNTTGIGSPALDFLGEFCKNLYLPEETS